MYCAQSACLRLLCLYMCLCRGQCPESFPRWPGRAGPDLLDHVSSSH